VDAEKLVATFLTVLRDGALKTMLAHLAELVAGTKPGGLLPPLQGAETVARAMPPRSGNTAGRRQRFAGPQSMACLVYRGSTTGQAQVVLAFDATVGCIAAGFVISNPRALSKATAKLM